MAGMATTSAATAVAATIAIFKRMRLPPSSVPNHARRRCIRICFAVLTRPLIPRHLRAGERDSNLSLLRECLALRLYLALCDGARVARTNVSDGLRLL